MAIRLNAKLVGAAKTKEKLKRALEKHSDERLKTTSKKAVEALKEVTPKDSGLASRSWLAKDTPEGAIIENTVDYITTLNAGSSRQAPARFVETTLGKFFSVRGTGSSR